MTEDAERIALTDDLRATLRGHSQRTGITIGALLRDRDDVPDGLQKACKNWFRPSVKFAQRAHIEYVLRLWQALPMLEMLPLTQTRLDALHDLKHRSGKGPNAMMAGAQDKPKGLNASIIKRWFTHPPDTVRKDHFEYVLARWESQIGGHKHAVPITKELRQRLRAQRDRTGRGSIALLNGAADRPEGLSYQQIESWLTGVARSARKDHLDYVLDRWAKLESNPRIPLEPADIETLRARYHASGLGLPVFLRQHPDHPEGLTVAILQGWLNGTTKTARKQHLEFVLTHWPEQPAESARLGQSDEDKRTVIKPGYRLDELPNNIRRIREAKGLTNEDLAGLTGVKRGTVNAWEVTTPSKRAVCLRIAKALGEPLEKVFPNEYG